jgi:hypothetical protein
MCVTSQAQTQYATILNHLPGATGRSIENAIKDHRVDGDGSAATAGKVQHFFFAPLNIVNERKGTPTGTWHCSHPHPVAQFISDQWLSIVEKHCEQNLIAIVTGRHRVILMIDYFENE